MNLKDAKLLTAKLMKEQGLGDWKFKYDYARNRFGCCKHSQKLITLSCYLVSMNDEETVKATILHEIAHALVGVGHGHNKVWKRKAIELGDDGERCYPATVTRPQRRWIFECSCGIVYRRHRRLRNAHCGRCRAPITWRSA